jgi:hypothetical protein
MSMVEKLLRSPFPLVVPPCLALVLWSLGCASTPAPEGAARPEVQLVDTTVPLVDFAVTPAASEPQAESAADSTCPMGMLLVDGMYCPGVRQVCARWVDPPTSAYPYLRCAEFKQPAACDGKRVHRRYCIDRDEYVRPPESRPLVDVSWTEAESTCEVRGARLCTEAEWELACEGERMLPYPYGFERDSTACNFDRTDLGMMGEGLNDHRSPPGAFPRCVSPFGVHDMVGNVDEWTRREGKDAPNRSALHGGWWLPGRNNCRAATLEHGESYFGKQVGFRCCEGTREGGKR